MNKIRQLCTMLVLAILFLVTTLGMTGCPAQGGIEKAAKTSLRLSDLTRDAIAATKTAYEGHVISLDTKDKAAAALDRLIAGGKTFNAAVIKANDAYKASGKADINTLRLLDSLLTTEVTKPFLDFLQLLGAVSSAQAPYLTTAINALRAAILLIGSFVSKNTVNLVDPLYNGHTAYLQNGVMLPGGA